jgi:CheY-like chemotaxis protein
MGRIEESGRHLLALISDILDVTKIRAGKVELHLGPVVVDEVCKASIRLVREQAQRKRISLTLRTGLDAQVVLGEERRLKQVLVNLLTNAVKFTPEGGRVGVDLEASEDGSRVGIEVWDTGIGIPAADQPRVFQPFVQLDGRLAREHAGTGLGLALTRQLVELQGGTIELESEVGRGSRFRVTFPAQRAPSAAPAGTTQSEALTTTYPPRRVLVAEDDETNISVLREYLVAQGHEVHVARHGGEVVAMARDLAPEIILMDVQMPVIDGLAAMRELRAAAETRQIPIIAVTALAMPGDRERCLDAGANDYLTKPVSLKGMLAVIEAHCAAIRRP